MGGGRSPQPASESTDAVIVVIGITDQRQELQTTGLPPEWNNISALEENLMSIPDQLLSHWQPSFYMSSQGSNHYENSPHATPKGWRSFRWPAFESQGKEYRKLHSDHQLILF